MRYEADRKQATRQRIIEAAGRRLKHDGIDGSGIATLMADAGLTVGAFYAHFASKDDLVATTVGDQLRRQTERFVAQASEPGGLEQLVRSYLVGAAHGQSRSGAVRQRRYSTRSAGAATPPSRPTPMAS